MKLLTNIINTEMVEYGLIFVKKYIKRNIISRNFAMKKYNPYR